MGASERAKKENWLRDESITKCPQEHPGQGEPTCEALDCTEPREEVT